MSDIFYQGAKVRKIVIPAGMGSAATVDGTTVTLATTTADTALTTHIDDTSAAHAATAISADSATLVGTGTTVQAVFEELDDQVATNLASIQAIEADGSVKARRISFTETAGAGTYTGQFVLVAGAILHSVSWETSAAWDATTTVLDVGYTGTLTAYGNDINVDAVGGDQVFGLDTEDPDDFPAGTTFNAILVTTGAGGTTGRSAVTIEFSVPPAATAATKV